VLTHQPDSLTAPASAKRSGQLLVTCRPEQLSYRYRGVQEGAGSDFGSIRIRNRSGVTCALPRGLRVKPQLASHDAESDAGAPMRLSLHRAGHRRIRLTPRRSGRHARAFIVTISGGYRDAPHGLCPQRHEVAPRAWLFRLESVHHRVINGRLPRRRGDLFDGSHPSPSQRHAPVESCGDPFVASVSGAGSASR
jgi:hypothetical protein